MLCRARGNQLCLNLIMQSDEAIFNTSVKCTVVTYELGFSTPRRTVGPSFFIQKTIDSIIYPEKLQQFAVPHAQGKTAHHLPPTGQRYTSFYLPRCAVFVRSISDRWLGKSSQIPWPLKPPDLTFLDSLVHRFVKSQVSRSTVTNTTELKY